MMYQQSGTALRTSVTHDPFSDSQRATRQNPRRGMRRVHNRAGELFRMAAYSLHHDKSPLGDYLRRMKSKLGPAGATTATAHKIAIIFYTMVKKQVKYDATLWAERDTSTRETLRSKTQTAGPATWLQTGIHRRKTCSVAG
jgi:hypothetical protein